MKLQNGTRAQTFLNGFKRAGKIPAVVEFVAAGSRFKSVILLSAADAQDFNYLM